MYSDDSTNNNFKKDVERLPVMADLDEKGFIKAELVSERCEIGKPCPFEHVDTDGYFRCRPQGCHHSQAPKGKGSWKDRRKRILLESECVFPIVIKTAGSVFAISPLYFYQKDNIRRIDEDSNKQYSTMLSELSGGLRN